MLPKTVCSFRPICSTSGNCGGSAPAVVAVSARSARSSVPSRCVTWRATANHRSSSTAVSTTVVTVVWRRSPSSRSRIALLRVM